MTWLHTRPSPVTASTGVSTLVAIEATYKSPATAASGLEVATVAAAAAVPVATWRTVITSLGSVVVVVPSVVVVVVGGIVVLVDDDAKSEVSTKNSSTITPSMSLK